MYPWRFARPAQLKLIHLQLPFPELLPCISARRSCCTFSVWGPWTSWTRRAWWRRCSGRICSSGWRTFPPASGDSRWPGLRRTAAVWGWGIGFLWSRPGWSDAGRWLRSWGCLCKTENSDGFVGGWMVGKCNCILVINKNFALHLCCGEGLVSLVVFDLSCIE